MVKTRSRTARNGLPSQDEFAELSAPTRNRKKKLENNDEGHMVSIPINILYEMNFYTKKNIKTEINGSSANATLTQTFEQENYGQQNGEAMNPVELSESIELTSKKFVKQTLNLAAINLPENNDFHDNLSMKENKINEETMPSDELFQANISTVRQLDECLNQASNDTNGNSNITSSITNSTFENSSQYLTEVISENVEANETKSTSKSCLNFNSVNGCTNITLEASTNFEERDHVLSTVSTVEESRIPEKSSIFEEQSEVRSQATAVIQEDYQISEQSANFGERDQSPALTVTKRNCRPPEDSTSSEEPKLERRDQVLSPALTVIFVGRDHVLSTPVTVIKKDCHTPEQTLVDDRAQILGHAVTIIKEDCPTPEHTTNFEELFQALSPAPTVVKEECETSEQSSNFEEQDQSLPLTITKRNCRPPEDSTSSEEPNLERRDQVLSPALTVMFVGRDPVLSTPVTVIKKDCHTPEKTLVDDRAQILGHAVTIIKEDCPTSEHTTNFEELFQALSPASTVIKEECETSEQSSNFEEQDQSLPLTVTKLNFRTSQEAASSEERNLENSDQVLSPANTMNSEDWRSSEIDFYQYTDDLNSLLTYAKSFRKKLPDRSVISADNFVKVSRKRLFRGENDECYNETHHLTENVEKMSKTTIETSSRAKRIRPLRERFNGNVSSTSSNSSKRKIFEDVNDVRKTVRWSDFRFYTSPEASTNEIEENNSDYGWEDAAPPKQQLEASSTTETLDSNILDKIAILDKGLKSTEFDLEKIEANKEDLFRVIENSIAAQSKKKLNELDGLIQKRKDDYLRKLYGTDEFISWDSDPALSNVDIVEKIKSNKSAVPAGAPLLKKMTLKYEMDASKQSPVPDNYTDKFEIQGRIKQIESEYQGRLMPPDLLQSIIEEKRRISDVVIKFLMPYYQEERILPKTSFRVVARKISHKFYETIADENNIKKYIDDLFVDCGILTATEAGDMDL